MHYNIIAEELIEAVNDDASSGKKWVYRFSESRSVDFYLADPQSPETLLSVPAKCFDIKRHALIDGEDETNNQKTIDDPTKITFSTSEDIPKGIASIAAAKKFDLYHSANMFSFAKRVKKNIRYSLFTIYMNEQIAILAVINEPSTSRVKTITPVSKIPQSNKCPSMPFNHTIFLFFLSYQLLKDCLLPEYFKQYSWSDRDKLAWTALTGDSPCILATKDPKLFQVTSIQIVVDFCATQEIPHLRHSIRNTLDHNPPNYRSSLLCIFVRHTKLLCHTSMNDGTLVIASNISRSLVPTSQYELLHNSIPLCQYSTFITVSSH